MPSASTFSSPHGTISFTLTLPAYPPAQTTPTLLLIHGNSSHSHIFRPIYSSSVSQTYSILTFDLPGHGLSSNAPDPTSSYTQPAYAALAASLLAYLGISRVVVLGWSLGGHIAIEMLPLLSSSASSMPKLKLLGIMITGTPPAHDLESIKKGFKSFPPDPLKGPAALEVLSAAQIDAFAHSSAVPFEPWMLEGVARTDGRARRVMFESFIGGGCSDQRKLVEEEKEVLVAVVNGGAEPFLDLDYLDQICWGRLWRAECVRLGELGHAPFWEDPGLFMPLFEEFVGDCVARMGEGED